MLIDTLISYLLLFASIFLGSAASWPYIAVSVAFPLLWIVNTASPRRSVLNIVVTSLWLLACTIGFFYLAIEFYCDGPGCDFEQRTRQFLLSPTYWGVLFLQVIVGLAVFFFTRWMDAGPGSKLKRL